MTKGKNESEEGVMGFKDKQKALDTLKALDGRDVSYQYHVITSFVSRTKRTLQITKDEEKLSNLREAMKIFEDWLKEYKTNNRGKENLAYLPLETVKRYRVLAKKYDVLDDEFYIAYKKENGDYKSLRNVKVLNGDVTWDIERNRRLKKIISDMKDSNILWYETDLGDFRGLPTKEHARCIMLGFSPDATKVRRLLSQVEEKFGSEEDAEMDVDAENEVTGSKRSRESSSSSGSEEEPERKILKPAPEKEDGGLSFKDKDRALQSIKSLEGRDVSYQYHAIAGLARRAERVISCTKDEQKIRNMREAVEVFEKWITDYNVNGRSCENFGYLPLNVAMAFKPLAERYKIEDNGFLRAYEQADGDYKKLRSAQVQDSDVTWDVERNKNLRTIVDRIKENSTQWYETESELQGLPSEEHTRCIMWGFSHDVARLKKLLPDINEKLKPTE